MPEVGVCIPWRNTHPTRARHIASVVDNFAALLPGAPLYFADSGAEVFSRAGSMNLAVRNASLAGCATVVISGADLVLYGDLAAVVSAAQDDGEAHIAYTSYVGLSASGTDLWYQGTPWNRCNAAYCTGGAVGGFVVMSTDKYWSLGGHDEAFVGWGYEDVDFAIKAQLHRHPGTVVGLWHEEDPDKTTRAAENAKLFGQRYP